MPAPRQMLAKVQAHSFFFLDNSWHLLWGSSSCFVFLFVYRLCSLCLLQHWHLRCNISFFPSPRAKMDLDLVPAAWAVVPGESFSFVFPDLFWLLCCRPGLLVYRTDCPPWRLSLACSPLVCSLISALWMFLLKWVLPKSLIVSSFHVYGRFF